MFLFYYIVTEKYTKTNAIRLCQFGRTLLHRDIRLLFLSNDFAKFGLGGLNLFDD